MKQLLQKINYYFSKETIPVITNQCQCPNPLLAQSVWGWMAIAVVFVTMLLLLNKIDFIYSTNLHFCLVWNWQSQTKHFFTSTKINTTIKILDNNAK